MTSMITGAGIAATLAQASTGQFGGYFSLPKIITVLVLMVPWLYAAPWVPRDVKLVRAPKYTWTASIVAAWLVGMAVWMLTPVFFVGLIIYILLAATPIVAYLVYRDGRVPPEHKVLTTERLGQVFHHERGPSVEAETKVKLYTCNMKVVAPPSGEHATAEEVDAYNLAQDLLYDVLWRRASEVDVTPAGQQQARVRFVVDGVPMDRPTLSLAESEAIIQYLKGLAGLDQEERRRPQKGPIAVDLAGSPVDMEIATAGSTGGQRMVIRVIQETVRTRLADLGMSDALLERVKAMTHTDNGLLIVSGPKRSGVTSTLYSLLRSHDAFIHQLVTLEEKIAVDLDNVTQHAYERADQLPQRLAAAMRRDPDVIMIDDAPSQQVAELIREAAVEKNVILGLRAADAFTALAKWVKTCGDAAGAVQPLRGVLCQILLRKLCPNCREAYRPDPQLLAKANLPSQRIKEFYRPPTQPLTDEKGNPITCPTCQGTGYFGRTAAFELLETTDELSQLIASGASLSQIKAAARKNKMLYLQEQALRKVIAGVTSIQEVLRVTQQNKQSTAQEKQ